MRISDVTIGADTISTVYFDSYTEALNEAEKLSHIASKRGTDIRGYTNGFHQAHTWNECMRLARHGWTEGRKMISELSSHLDITGRLAKPEIIFDVTGESGYDMGRVCEGVPESVMDWRDTDISSDKHAHDNKIIKIGINTTYSSGINKEVINARGAALVALIDALESAGKRVELWAVLSLAGSYNYDKSNFETYICLKNADEHLQIDMVAFACAHADFLRRILFALYNTTPTGRKHDDTSSRGIPCMPRVETDWDIYLPHMIKYDSNFQSVPNTLAWIKRALADLGVSLQD